MLLSRKSVKTLFRLLAVMIKDVILGIARIACKEKAIAIWMKTHTKVTRKRNSQ